MANSDELHLRGWIEARNPDDFEQLVRRYAGVVLGTCNRILRNTADAEDAAQDCFLILAQSPPQLGTRLGAWLHRVATRRCLDLLKARRRRLRRELLWFSRQPRHAQIDWNDYHAAVDQAIDALPDNLRTALIAHYFEGQTHEAIAQTEGVSRPAITQRIHKGVDTIRETLARQGVQVTGTALAAALTQLSAEAAPAELTVRLIKIGIATDATRVSVGSTLLTQKAWLAIPLVAFAGWAAWQIAPLSQNAQDSSDSDGTADSAALIPTAPDQTQSDTPAAAISESSTQSSTATPATSVESADLRTGRLVNRDYKRLTAQTLWQRVLEVNRPWLKPDPVYLYYVSNLGGPVDLASSRRGSRREVRLYGDTGRTKEGSKHEMMYKNDKYVYSEAFDHLENFPAHEYGLSRSKRQGIFFNTGMHALADFGLPSNAWLHGDSENPNIATIKVDLKEAYARSGGSEYPIDLLVLTINTQTYTPIREDIISYHDDNPYYDTFTYDAEFFEVGDGRAPSSISVKREYRIKESGRKDHMTEARFQVIDGLWILDRIQRYTDGSPDRNYTYLSEISTEPFDLALIAYPTAEELDRLKAQWRPSGNLGRGNQNQPVVVAVYPKHGDRNLEENQTIRIVFDRPMNPGRMEINFEEGGFLDTPGSIVYHPDTYEFSIPLRLAQGTLHRVIVNNDPKRGGRDDGFSSVAGDYAIPYRWSFETASASVKENAPTPKPVLTSPASGSMIELLQTVEIAFDQPMNPDRYAIDVVEGQDEMYFQHGLRDATYDAELQKFRFELELPPGWKGAIEFDGIVSEDGVPADPLTLNFETPKFDESYSVPRDAADNASRQRLMQLLSAMGAMRDSLHALTEEATVLRLNTRAGTGIYIRLESSQTMFAFQGETQFIGDVSNIMNPRFIVGSDGESCWLAGGGTRERPPSLVVLPIDDVPDKYLSFCDPFRLQEFDPETAIETIGLRYVGTEFIQGRNCYIVEAEQSHMGRKIFNVHRERWLIDSATLRTFQYISESSSSTTITTFTHTSVNERLPDSLFRAPDTPGQTRDEPTPIEPGFEHRLLTVSDGQNGHMSVRWGTNKGSGGLNHRP